MGNIIDIVPTPSRLNQQLCYYPCAQPHKNTLPITTPIWAQLPAPPPPPTTTTMFIQILTTLLSNALTTQIQMGNLPRQSNKSNINLGYPYTNWNPRSCAIHIWNLLVVVILGFVALSRMMFRPRVGIMNIINWCSSWITNHGTKMYYGL